MDHKWRKDRDGAEFCERVGCAVRKRVMGWNRDATEWQRTRRGHWRQTMPIPPCTGKEAAESAFFQPVTVYALECNGAWHATTSTCPSEADTKCGRRIGAVEFRTTLDAQAARCQCAVKPAPSPLEVVRDAVAWLESSERASDRTYSARLSAALATLEESIREDERSRAATVVDGYARRETKVSVRAPLLAAAADIRGTK